MERITKVKMKITAITKFKHAGIWNALTRLNWSATELATRCQVSVTTITGILNLNRRPSSELADKIQNTLGKAGEYIDVLGGWPESFKGMRSGCSIEQTANVEPETLVGNLEAMMVAAPENCDREQAYNAIDSAIADLPKRHQEVLKYRFYENLTYDQIGKIFSVTRERTRQIEHAALRKLRHPVRIQKLEEAYY